MRKRLIALALASALTLVSGTAALAAPLSATSHSSSLSASPSGISIVSTALAYVGDRYAYYGDTPSTGFSCTGFVHWVFQQFGYQASEDVATLYDSYPHVNANDLMPGDVLIFANTFHPGLSHAAIYIGGGQMVGADNFYVGVHVDSVWDSYWGPRYVGAVRIAPVHQPSTSVEGFSYHKPAQGSVARVMVAIAALRVRTEPSWQGGTITVVYYGAHLTVQQHGTDGWLNVRTANGTTGWVNSIYVSS